MPNRLAECQSPYLRQHAHNPVDWYPWGPEALALAKSLDRPLLVSIGYSACHWCHVMERESFEDPETAALMNRTLVCVKVDREERPDLDDVYQHAVQLLGRHGGWPLTMFLAPDGTPFFGGTYFPKESRHGMPSFRRILEGVSEAFRLRRREIDLQGRQLLETLRELGAPKGTPGVATEQRFSLATARLLSRVDPVHGGFGSAPKFPNAMDLEALWRAGLLGRAEAREATLRALAAMAAGGIHDQLGGGFHRYSTDERWLVPHFEKMLYDNALLAPLYASAFLETGDGRSREVLQGIFDWMAREMTSPEGALYATQDADSEGEEGRFFAWSPDEIRAAVGDEAVAQPLCATLGVTLAGNFEGKNVLTLKAGWPRELRPWRETLFAAREQRVHPFRDEKVIASWNGLAISALARGALALSAPALLGRARAAMAFVRGRLTDPSGRLLRSYLGAPAPILAFAEDHAFLAVAAIDLYEAGLEPADLTWARALTDALLARFWSEADAAFFVTASDAEPLVHRPLSLYDNAIPSATSMGLEALQRLAALTGDGHYREVADQIVRRHLDSMEENPFGFGRLLCGLDRHLRGPIEIVLAGPRSDPRTQALHAAAGTVELPNRLIAHVEPGSSPAWFDRPLWEGRTAPPVPTAYVCRAGSCLAPVTDPAALPAALKDARHA
ncbi:MAG: thioredoxin domain-containing protein [Deltaproteobacteria bacterium]